MDFMDLASRYATARFDNATQPFNDPEAYMAQRLGMQEPDTEGNVKPKSTTINYNDDGTQTITNKVDVAPATQPAPVAQPQFNFGPQPTPVAEVMPTPVAPIAQPQTAPVMQTPPAPVMQPAVMAPPVAGAPQAIINDQGQVVGRETPEQMVAGAQTNAPVAPIAPPTAPPVANVPSEVPQANALPAQPVAPVAPPTAPVMQTPPAPQMMPTAAPAAVAPTAPVATPQTAPVAMTPPPAPVVQPAPVAVPQWQNDLSAIQKDPTQLAAYVGNTANPSEARALAAELWQRNLQTTKQEQQAEKTVMDAAQGDPKAQNDMVKAIRSSEGSYIKAILFSRLGLGDLAREEQQKLGAGTTVGRSILDGKSFATEVNGQGFITRAWDETGRAMDNKTIAKLNSDAVKQGSQAYSSTGEIHITPDKRQVVKTFNSITGKPQWMDIESGEQWRSNGRGNPVPSSIGTAIAKKEGTEAVTARYAGPIAYTRAAAGFAGKFNTENGTNIGYQSIGGGTPVLVDRNAGNRPVEPDAQGNINAVKSAGPGVTPVPTATTATTAPTAAGPAGTVSPASTVKTQPQPQFKEPGFETETPTAFKSRTEAWAAANKKVVGQESVKQYGAQNVYGIVKDINTALQTATGSGVGAKVDELAAWFGGSTEGARASAQLSVLGDTLLKSVPRFEGPQSDIDVASYQAAAGKLADPKTPNATRAAAFQTIINLNKKYAPELDWSFSGKGAGATTAPTAPSANTKVIGGVTYVYDGRGWKAQP